jgi:hypothetical protein
MQILAKALIDAAAFLELSGEDIIHLDDAVRALESIGDTLRSASPAELSAIRAALSDLIATERAGTARADLLRFYEHFFESFGLSYEPVA